jgi:hypothetical protein
MAASFLAMTVRVCPTPTRGPLLLIFTQDEEQRSMQTP